MPNIKSAKKRVKVIEKKTLRNNMIKSGYKSAVRKFDEAVNAGKIDEAKVLLSEATKKIDQACSKGVIVKNTAARKKSSLSKKLMQLWPKTKIKIMHSSYLLLRRGFYKRNFSLALLYIIGYNLHCFFIFHMILC